MQTLNSCLKNQYIAPIAFMLGFPLHSVHAIQRWRTEVGPHIADWFKATGQIEALSSIAEFTFDNPDYSFATILPDSQPPLFEAHELGHPLLSKDNCVSNDIRLDQTVSLIMVSGSNMSGKSTLLRSIGINLVLSLCGAPVKAKSLTTSRFQIGSVMRSSDSLQHGESLFYSVISRIKSVIELTGQPIPLLFLMDEILQGTNSNDRKKGAEGIIKQLVTQQALGLVTTHDLALTRIVESLEGRAINIHFEDHLINGKMHFDYKIRPGVVKKSNALELMRMIGLSVGDEYDS